MVDYWCNGMGGHDSPWKGLEGKLALQETGHLSLRCLLPVFTLEMYREMEHNLFVLLHIVPDFFKGIKLTVLRSMSGVGLVVLAPHFHVLRYSLTSGCAY